MTVLTLDTIFDCLTATSLNSGLIGKQNNTALGLRTMSIGTSPRRNSSSSSTGSGARPFAVSSSSGKKPGKRPGRKPSKVDEHAKLERSRQSARECRARKKLRYQYLEELVLNREKAVFALRDELETLKQWCLQLDSDVNVPEALLKVIVAEDLRNQKRQQQSNEHKQQRVKHEQQHHQMAEQQRQLKNRMHSSYSSSSSNSSSPPQMSLHQYQQLQQQQWRRQLSHKQHSAEHQGTSSQQPLSPLVNASHRDFGTSVSRRESVPGSVGQQPPRHLQRQLAIDLPHTPPYCKAAPLLAKQLSSPRQHSSDSVFERQQSLDLNKDLRNDIQEFSQGPTHQNPHINFKPVSTDSFYQQIPTFVHSVSQEQEQFSKDIRHPTGVKTLLQHQRQMSESFQDVSRTNPLHPQRFSPTHTNPQSRGQSSSLDLDLFTKTMTPSIPSVKLTSPREDRQSFLHNETSSQTIFPSTQPSLPDLNLLSHPSPRPLTQRFPSPLRSSSPFDPHTKLRKLTNVHCYSSTRTFNTTSLSPYRKSPSPYSVPVGLDMTPSPSSYRNCLTPSSSTTTSPAPLMSLNTFLDTSLASVVSDMPEETQSRQESALPNFLFSQHQSMGASARPVNVGNSSVNSSIPEPIPQFYSFLADLQDVDMTLNYRPSSSSRSNSQVIPAHPVMGPDGNSERLGDQVPTTDASTLNLPTIISDFLNNSQNQMQ